MKRLPFFILPAIALALGGCSSALRSPANQPAVEPTAILTTQPLATSTQASAIQPVQPTADRTIQLAELSDSQGAVTVIVKPIDLFSSRDMLSFEVLLDTHSIDLSMDLAALATLTTDSGQSVQAALWDAPRGGASRFRDALISGQRGR
jgi:hypothetical protein